MILRTLFDETGIIGLGFSLLFELLSSSWIKFMKASPGTTITWCGGTVLWWQHYRYPCSVNFLHVFWATFHLVLYSKELHIPWQGSKGQIPRVSGSIWGKPNSYSLSSWHSFVHHLASWAADYRLWFTLQSDRFQILTGVMNLYKYDFHYSVPCYNAFSETTSATFGCTTEFEVPRQRSLCNHHFWVMECSSGRKILTQVGVLWRPLLASLFLIRRM